MMGGKGSGRPTDAQRIVNKHFERKAPIATYPQGDTFFVPNHSGIASHPEAKENFVQVSFANIHVHDAGATPQDIPTGLTYTKCDGFTDNGGSKNCTADATNDKITITKKGYYLVNHNSSFTGDTNNVTYYAAVFMDSVEQDNLHCVRKLATAGDVGSMSFCGVLQVSTVPIDVDVRIRHSNAGTVEYTMEYANLTVSYLGEI